MSGAGSAPVQNGDIVADKYEVIRTLGKGGMGFVVAARHTTLDQIVAIKFLVRMLGDSEEAAARFLREARAAARITSDYVCKVFDTGTLPNGSPYFVMELLDGIDLEQELDQRGRLPVEEAVDYTMQALDAIAIAHKLGIVHRDLKPANLFLTERADGTRRLKVFDFGISKTDELDASPTDTQGIIGTPAYMSPEQARNSKKADHRTDIFSLGAILYEMLSGRPPHTGESIGEVLESVMNTKPPEISALRPELPEELSRVIMKALEQDREDRFGSAHELARALAPFASTSFASLAQSIPAPGASVRSLPPETPRPTTASRETVAGWTQGGLLDLYQRRRGYVAFGIGALLISLGVWIAMARSKSDEPRGAAGRTGTETASAPGPESAVPNVAANASAAASARAIASVLAPATPDPSAAAPSTSSSANPPPRRDKSESATPGLQKPRNKGNPLLDNRE